MSCKSYQLHHTIQDQIISSKFDVYCVLFLVITRSHRWSIFDEILPQFVLRIESGEDTSTLVLCETLQAVDKYFYYPVDISTTVFSYTRAVQYLFYYIHYTCIQNRVRAMKTKRPRYIINENATMTVHTWLASTCVAERRHC